MRDNLITVARSFAAILTLHLCAVAMLFAVGLAAEVDLPKESIHRPGLDRDVLVEVCSESIRADCIGLDQ